MQKKTKRQEIDTTITVTTMVVAPGMVRATATVTAEATAGTPGTTITAMIGMAMEAAVAVPPHAGPTIPNVQNESGWL